MGMTNKEFIDKLTENIPTWKLILIDKWTDFKVWVWLKTHTKEQKMGMTINIIKGTTNYEFYGVSDKVGKAIITLFHECENDNSSIVSAQSEVEDGNND